MNIMLNDKQREVLTESLLRSKELYHSALASCIGTNDEWNEVWRIETQQRLNITETLLGFLKDSVSVLISI